MQSKFPLALMVSATLLLGGCLDMENKKHVAAVATRRR